MGHNKPLSSVFTIRESIRIFRFHLINLGNSGGVSGAVVLNLMIASLVILINPFRFYGSTVLSYLLEHRNLYLLYYTPH